MVNSKVVKYMVSGLIVLSALPFQAHAQQIKLDDETKNMRNQYWGSELGKFTKNRKQDSQKLRLFMNSLHRESMRLSAGIQQQLVANRNASNYPELYTGKEQDFVSLRFCIETHKYFNGVSNPAQINAGAALWYTAAAKKCDASPIKNYMKTQGGIADLWRHFNVLVEKSLPIAQTKKNKYQNDYSKFVTAQTQKNLGSYKSAPYAKMLRPDQAPVTAPVVPVKVSAGDMPPLPIAPFQHDQKEWAVITKHVEGLVDRIGKKTNNPLLIHVCRPVIESKKHQQNMMLPCSSSMYGAGLQFPKMKTQIEAFYNFTAQYDASASAAQQQEAIAKVDTPISMALPTGKPKYVVAELNTYRNVIKSADPAAFKRCNSTDTAGLTDNLKTAKNKKDFLRVTRGLLICAKKLHQQDKTKYAKLYQNLNTYFKGARAL